METSHQKDQAMIRSLTFSAPPSLYPPPPFSREGEGLEMELMIIRACMRSLHKTHCGAGELPSR